MPGASIFRWSMSYFASAYACLMIALGLLAGGFAVPSDVIDAPDTLVIVHLIALGWLGLLFMGALLQFVSVLAAATLRMAWLAAPALVFLLAGLGTLITGFLSLEGHLAIDPVGLSIGGGMIAAGLTAVGLAVGATIVSQKALGTSAILVLGGLLALAVTVITGNLLAALVSGELDVPYLAIRLHLVVPFHAASGALGWMTLTAIGVSYRLFAMFMLSPEADHAIRPSAVLAVAAFAGFGSAFGVSLYEARGAAALTAACCFVAALAVAFYVRDVWHMYNARRRRSLELNSIGGLGALGFLAFGIMLLCAAVWFQSELPLARAGFYVIFMGWLSGLGLAQLYKIVPFLTWLETYGPVMGKTQVPRVQDLVNERRAAISFAVFYSSVALGALSILLGSDTLFQYASIAQFGAVGALALELFRARRLDYAPAKLRLPHGAIRPHLIYAKTNTTE